MRYDPEQKERTHRQILTEAASALRIKGPERVGVAEVMNRLGLTHGGFYAHFDSKDDLIAQSVTLMFDEAYARLLRMTEGRDPLQGLQAYVDWYLSAAHRDAPNGGCPVAAISGDLARLPNAARERYTEGVERLAAAITQLLQKLGSPKPATAAFSLLSEMAGALTCARAVISAPRSEQILRASRDMVKARLPNPGKPT
jgi:TetR/AcrR family transcriptional repressor of nem operon